MPIQFSAAEITSIPEVLSQPRFATYLKEKNGDVETALKLYHWNAHVSASFLFPIHVFEICVRNAVANALESAYGAWWPWERTFELSLPDHARPSFSPRREITAVRLRHATSGKIIADTKFAFWVAMYTARHDGRLWRPFLAREFPHLPAGTAYSVARLRINQVGEQVRMLRNRIAHHEPIFTRNLADAYAGVVEVIGYRCANTAGWVDRTQSVSALLPLKP